MANLGDIIGYILQEYPNKEDLSNARVTKMVYLADWYNALKSGKTVSDITWFYDNYGPFVWDVKDAVDRNPAFGIKPTETVFGNRKDIFVLRDRTFHPKLSGKERSSIQHVIDQTRRLGWADFIKLVYSTYPVASSPKYSELDLQKLAKKYKAAAT